MRKREQRKKERYERKKLRQIKSELQCEKFFVVKYLIVPHHPNCQLMMQKTNWKPYFIQFYYIAQK